MAIKAIDLRRGQAVNHKDGIWVCIDNQKVAKGNWRSYQVIQLRNIATGQLIKDRFRTDEQFEQAIVDRKNMEYLYSDSTGHVFMDPETFEQIQISEDLIGDDKVYLQPNCICQITYVEGQPVTAEMPNTVELVVVDTPPNIKGATATNQLKEAECEGGAKVKVPPFIENGEKIKVDTRTGEYVSRV
jgi:elongation factor P